MFRGGTKAGLRESFIEINRQDVVAVGRNAKLGVRLSGRRTNHGKKFLFLKSMNALDRKGSDTSLLSLLNFETDKQIVLFALVVILDLVRDLGVQKSVRQVKKAHRLRIGFHQPPAESPP